MRALDGINPVEADLSLREAREHIASLRDEVRAREGNAFSLRDFHARALDLGSVGLDVLRDALLAQ